MAILLSNDMPVADFVAAVSRGNWPEETLLLAFTHASHRFERFAPDDEFMAATIEGRLFSPAGELRWRRINGSFRAVYLGEGPSPLQLEDTSSHLEGLRPEQGEFILWGVRSDLENEWLEQQVPQRFSYPLDGEEYPCGRAAVVVENWVDGAGFSRFSRYHRIKEISGESHATK